MLGRVLLRDAKRPLARFPDIVVYFAAALLTVCLAAVATGADDLSALRENVRVNEELYADVEVSSETRYELGADVEVARPVDSTFNEHVKRAYTTQFVTQGSLYRLQIEGESRDVDGKSMTCDRVKAYDGVVTRQFEQNAFGNIIQGRSTDEHFIRPHTLLLKQQFPFRLSTLLGGNAAITADPERNPNQNDIFSVSYEGDDVVGELRCHKVHVNGRPAGRSDWLGRCELWLAVDRNYIPAKFAVFMPGFSKEVPVAEAGVNEWIEVKPSIWFPAKAEYIAWDKFVVRDKQKKQVRWRERTDVHSVLLDPVHDVSFFRDVRFPPGIPMYEVSDGKITTSYRIGSPADANGQRPNSFRYWWLICGNLAVVGVLVAIVVMRRRQSARRSTPL